MTLGTVRLPEQRVWLRVASPTWDDALDPSWARLHGGRWNPPESFATLYLNGDVVTARTQIDRMLDGSPATIDDLADDAYVLVAATLPSAQRCAQAVTDAGLTALDLPDTYPLDARGAILPQRATQRVGARVRRQGLRGVWCRSAATRDGSGRELAWFPATRAKARPVWPAPLPLTEWRYARGWAELGLSAQPDPAP